MPEGIILVDKNNLPLSPGRGLYVNVANSPFTLTSSWTKVCTTTIDATGLIIAPIVSATALDIEWTSVAIGANAPSDTYGVPIFGGEDFSGGIPVGDIYCKSITGQAAIVKVGG